MEKYSAFRDPGTGIQPFLVPVPPADSESFGALLWPIGAAIGIVRTSIVLIVGVVYVLLLEGLCLLVKPIPALHDILTSLFNALFGRLILFVTGFLWIPVEQVNLKRRREEKSTGSWKPRAGDIIVSNWVSWVELLWLAARFNPIFVLPVANPAELPATSVPSTPIKGSPGRRSYASAVAPPSPASRTPTKRNEILGFIPVSIFSVIFSTGRVPPYDFSPNSKRIQSLKQLRSKATRPIVVFPECTTSNGRGLLRFSEVFGGEKAPVSGYKVFVMSVRIDPPTKLRPTISWSVPGSLNPIKHIFLLCSSLLPHNLSIRLLSPADSPSSQTIAVSEVLQGSSEGTLTETCASLVATIGRMKRTGMGWEDKSVLLSYYNSKKR